MPYKVNKRSHVVFLVRSKLVIVVPLKVDADVGHSQNGLVNVDQAMNQTTVFL